MDKPVRNIEDFCDATDEVCGAIGWDEITLINRLTAYLALEGKLDDCAKYLRSMADAEARAEESQ